MHGKRKSPDGLIPKSSLLGRITGTLGGYSPILRWYRALRPRQLWLQLDPIGRSTRRYLEQNDLTVKRGFAAGIRYPDKAVGRIGFLATKLIGAYEHDLDPVLERELPSHELFVDVGSGEGYYCLATARRFPNMTVIGYETDNAERLMAREIAALNMISCEFRGTADPAGIAALPEARLFLMVDIEGGEFEFCDPATIPRLRTATLLIEVHPATCENLRETLINRFAETHEYELVLGQPKRIDDWPELTGWPSKRANMAVTEGRPALPEWLLLKPR